MTPKWRSFDHSIIRRDDAIKGHLCILADERTVVVACTHTMMMMMMMGHNNGMMTTTISTTSQ